MPDENKKTGAVQLVIPDEAKEKYPDLIPQIVASPSMDDEEKNYWFSVLPIMTDDQIAELRDILDSERKRLAAADSSKKPEVEIDAEKAAQIRAEKAEERQKEEELARKKDDNAAEDILADW